MPVPTFLKRQTLTIATACLFGVAVWRVGLRPELPAVLAFIFGGVLLAVIDWRVQRLPTRLVHQTFAAVAGGLLFASIVEWDWVPLATAAAGGLVLSGAFLLVYVAARQFSGGMLLLGFGDVRLAAVLGMLLGWYGLEYVASGALVGHVLAVVVAVVRSVGARRVVLRYSFGPPLIVGTLAVVLFQAA